MSEFVAYQYYSETFTDDLSENLHNQQAAFVPRLNELGAQGWEMISLVTKSSSAEVALTTFHYHTYTAYFKRPYIQQN